MKRKLKLILPIVLLVAVSSNCAPKTITDPATRKAYTTNEVIKRIGEFQSVVIDSYDKGKIPVADARLIVTWISGEANTNKVGVVDLLIHQPQNWKELAGGGWSIVRDKVASYPSLKDWVGIIDSLLQGVQ